MSENKHLLGTIKITQIQPSGLIVETPSGEIYDPSRLLQVERLFLTHQGIEVKSPNGELILDIHHTNHPQTHGKGYNAISVGFSAHYRQMRADFGDHMVDGIAGENIIIQSEELVWLADLGDQVLVEGPSGRRQVLLDVKKIAAPCEEFSHFAANSQGKRLPAGELKETLKLLGDGRRGFLLALNPDQEAIFVQPGDFVFALR
ncbi:MAG: hypothetical protein JSV42_08205 [Chloroflexota bacterium]|nr:MAG: hypothetical protein JSV42_08205 [Chloroflexota bacterium]